MIEQKFEEVGRHVLDDNGAKVVFDIFCNKLKPKLNIKAISRSYSVYRALGANQFDSIIDGTFPSKAFEHATPEKCGDWSISLFCKEFTSIEEVKRIKPRCAIGEFKVEAVLSAYLSVTKLVNEFPSEEPLEIIHDPDYDVVCFGHSSLRIKSKFRPEKSNQIKKLHDDLMVTVSQSMTRWAVSPEVASSAT